MSIADLYEALTGTVGWQEWRERAACRGLPAEMFLPDRGESSREAKAVCRECEVSDDCLAYALENHERWGVWGGLSERQRKVARRDMPRPKAQHGTVSRYSHGCHCDECKAAYAAYRRSKRIRGVQDNIAELRTQRNRRRRVG